MDREMETLDSALDQIRKKAVVEAVDAMVREQIKITGTKTLYERIDRSFKEGTMEPYFLKEQWMLYSWRERFFQHHFPLSCWYTEGADDSHDLDTVPFQVTTNFDSLMTMAASMRQPKVYGEKIYLENDEEISNSVRKKWDVNPEHGFDFGDFDDYENFDDFDEYDYADFNELMSFSFTVHKLAELHLKGPKKLEELAMRAVISNGISLVEMSRELKKKSVDGMYVLEDDAPEHIDNAGEKSFKRLKRLFMKMKAGENVASSLKAKLHQSVCTIFPEDLVVTDSEEEDTREMTSRSSNTTTLLPLSNSTNKRKLEEDIPTREMTSGSSNTATLLSLSNSTNKRKLEEGILQRKERELQLLKLAWMKADLDKKAKSYKMMLVDIQIQREKQAMEAGQDKKAKSNKMKLADIQIQREKQVMDKKAEFNEMKLVDIQAQREKQFIAWSNAGQDEKKSKRGPHPGPSH